MSDSTILEGPDGRLYEIPLRKLAEFAVPGERVAELRRKMANHATNGASNGSNGHHSATESAVPPGHAAMPPGHVSLPPGHAAMPPGHTAAPAPSMSVNPGGGVVLNFYFQAPPTGTPAAVSVSAPHNAASLSTDSGVQGYHMSFDESGIPTNHTDMLWGDYIDKQGNPAVGWHSHDPVSGNAQ